MYDIVLVNRGAIAEQFIGQQLLNAGPEYQFPELFYWKRENPGSSAEVDYLIESGAGIVPVEVKAGKTGRLRSLHQFTGEKKLSLAVRFNQEKPNFNSVIAQRPNQVAHGYELLSLPLYLVNEVNRLLDEVRTAPG